MDFGQVHFSQLDTIDYTLPPDPESNADVLNEGKGNTKYYIGLSVKGNLTYSQYSQLFNSVEYSGSFYAVPSEEQIVRHRAEVGSGFKYCAKFPQTITHLNRLKNCEESTELIQNTFSGLGDKLGPCLIGIHPGIGPSKLDTIYNFLKLLRLHASFEVRHEVWFKGGYNPDLLAALIANNVGTIITDTPGRRDAVHMHLSTPVGFVRFGLTGIPQIDTDRLTEWSKRLKLWAKQGLEECYFFIHGDLKVAGDYAKTLQKLLGNS